MIRITLGKSIAVSDKGKRRNNEDCVYPLPEEVNPSDRLYLLCDGVGGANKGEVASYMACDSVDSFFNTFKEEPVDASFIQKAVHYAEVNFDKYVSAHPEAKGMATTMAMLYFDDSSVFAAHIGDSRIYQFREGKIVFRTEDHSLVNSLIKMGQMTEEEARASSQKNVILRAIQGSNNQVDADIAEITDIESDDCFMICSDGVVESFTDHELELLFHKNDISQIKDALMTKCLENSRDNFSFYIIPVTSLQPKAGFSKNVLSLLYSFI